MFWTRPKGIKVITRNDDFWNIATKPPIYGKEQVFLLRCDITPPSPQPVIFPCKIIGLCEKNSYRKYWFKADFKPSFPLQFTSDFVLENLDICGVDILCNSEVTFTFRNISIGDLSVNGIKFDSVSPYTLGYLIIENADIVVGNASPTSILVKGGKFDISNVLISRPNNIAGNDTIYCGYYSSGMIKNIQVETDLFTAGYILSLNADNNETGLFSVDGIRALTSKKILHLYGLNKKYAIARNINIGSYLGYNGIKIMQYATVDRLYITESPASVAAIKLVSGGRLSNSYLVSDNSNGAIQADKDCQINNCVINVPTAGMLGVDVIDEGTTTRGYFNYNKGYGAGNHLRCAASITDFTAKFNSNCAFVNPKPDFAYNS